MRIAAKSASSAVRSSRSDTREEKTETMLVAGSYSVLAFADSWAWAAATHVRYPRPSAFAKTYTFHWRRFRSHSSGLFLLFFMNIWVSKSLGRRNLEAPHRGPEKIVHPLREET